MYRLFTEAGDGHISRLTALFNHSIQLVQVPNEWKMAIGTPLFKGGSFFRHFLADFETVFHLKALDGSIRKVGNVPKIRKRIQVLKAA